MTVTKSKWLNNKKILKFIFFLVKVLKVLFMMIIYKNVSLRKREHLKSNIYPFKKSFTILIIIGRYAIQRKGIDFASYLMYCTIINKSFPSFKGGLSPLCTPFISF
jgi:hypothetical protein